MLGQRGDAPRRRRSQKKFRAFRAGRPAAAGPGRFAAPPPLAAKLVSVARRWAGRRAGSFEEDEGLLVAAGAVGPDHVLGLADALEDAAGLRACVRARVRGYPARQRTRQDKEDEAHAPAQRACACVRVFECVCVCVCARARARHVVRKSATIRTEEQRWQGKRFVIWVSAPGRSARYPRRYGRRYHHPPIGLC